MEVNDKTAWLPGEISNFSTWASLIKNSDESPQDKILRIANKNLNIITIRNRSEYCIHNKGYYNSIGRALFFGRKNIVLFVGLLNDFMITSISTELKLEIYNNFIYIRNGGLARSELWQ